MNSWFRVAASLITVSSFSTSLSAQIASHNQPSAKRPAQARQHGPSLQQQVLELQKELREQNAKLQEEIDTLKSLVVSKQNEAATLEQTAQKAQEKATQAQAQVDISAQQNAVALNELRGAVATESAHTATTIAQVQTKQLEVNRQLEEPGAIRYKGVTLRPGGFFAGESVWRQRALNADIYSNFNAIPYPGADEAHTSEWVPTARQSRVSLLASGKVPFATLRGFFEGDFLSAAITSNNLQSNSYTLRVRQAWAQADAGRFIFTAGQMWSLLTEDKKAAQPGQEALPLFFDANYHVGFTYARQVAFRAQIAFTPAITGAIALENSQDQFSASNAPSNFFFGSAGATGGLNNSNANYTNQLAPDVLAKLSFDSGYGHYELGGVARLFRDRFYPAGASSTAAQNDTKLGGGFLANTRFPVTKMANVGLHLLMGDGTGRYGASILPDITVKPDGTLEPLRNAQGMFSLELHPAKNLDLFGYGGTEYVQRTYYPNATGTLVGYAPPTASNAGCFVEVAPAGNTGYAPGTGTCLGATRLLVQGSAGYVYRLYSGPAGSLQYGLAYSYLTRNGWSGAGGAPKAVNNFVYTSVRYYLP